MPLTRLVAVLALLTACHAGSLRPAPFRVRPDSVEAGSLAGPFDGRVLDAVSGDPVVGALVYATWSFESGYGVANPGGFREAVTSTDENGRYRIAALTDGPGRSGRVADFYLVVYKRGFVAYRSDRRFDDFGPRLDFAQHGLEIPLERWRGEYSHVRHLRFVGGGTALATLTAWELEAAAAELTAQHAGPRVRADLVIAQSGLVAGQLLDADDIKPITHFDGGFESGPLNDEPDTDVYSSEHFKALGQPETFDIAVRLWRIGPDEAQKRYRELAESLPQVSQTDEIADRSLRAIEKQIYGVAFLDLHRGVVVLITCGEAQCKSADVLVALGRKAYDKIKHLLPAGNAPAGEPTP